MSGDWLTGVWEKEWSSSANTTAADSSNNLTIQTCAARSLQSTSILPFPTTLIIFVRAVQGLVYILSFVLGIFLNSLVIVLVAKYKKLRTRSFIIALQVVVSNVLLSVTLNFVRPITVVANQWLFGEHLCVMTGYFFLVYILSRSLLMFAFVIDRFLAVFWSFSYKTHSTKIMVPLCASIWAFVIVLRAIGLPWIFDCYAFTLPAYQCVHFSGCSPACGVVANVSVGIIMGPATVVPIILYGILYWKAWKLKQDYATKAAEGIGGPGSRNVVPKVSNREWRATITFFLLFVSVFALTTPLIIITLVAESISRMLGPSPALYVVASFSATLVSLTVIADPIVILRSHAVKAILIELKAKTYRRWNKEEAKNNSTELTR